MPHVRMPDGTVVDMPDQLDPETASRLQSYMHEYTTRGQVDPSGTVGADVLHDVGQRWGGLNDLVNTSLLNMPAQAAHGVMDLIHRITGAGSDAADPALLNMMHAHLSAKSSDGVQPIADVLNAIQQSAPGQVVASGLHAADSALGEHAPVLQDVLHEAGGVASDVASIAPVAGGIAKAVGAGGDALATARAAAAAPIDPANIDAALDAAGYQRLPSKDPSAGIVKRTAANITGEGSLAPHQTLTNQAVTDALARGDAGVPEGVESNAANLAEARKGPTMGAVYDAAKQSLPPQLTQSPELQSAIQAIGDNTSQLPRSPDVDALKQTMLGQPTMTRDELFSNVQQARQRASTFMASQEPDKVAMGEAYQQLANAYEDFIGKQLQANPASPVSMSDFLAARKAFAKNYTVEAALKGPEAGSVDAAAIARQAKGNPGMMDGGLRLVAAQHARSPLTTGYGPTTLADASTGSVGSVPGTIARHITGPTAGAGVGFLLGGPPGAAVGSAAGYLTGEASQALLRRVLAGSPASAGEIAAAAAENPRLAHFFNPPPGVPPSTVPPRGSIAGLLSHEPAAPPGPTVNAGGGAATTSILDELGLTPDVQRAGPAHPGTATRGEAPDAAGPQDMAIAHPPLVQKWGDFSLAPSQPRGTSLFDQLAAHLDHGVEGHAPELTASTPSIGEGLHFSADPAHSLAVNPVADRLAQGDPSSVVELADRLAQGGGPADQRTMADVLRRAYLERRPGDAPAPVAPGQIGDDIPVNLKGTGRAPKQKDRGAARLRRDVGEPE